MHCLLPKAHSPGSNAFARPNFPKCSASAGISLAALATDTRGQGEADDPGGAAVVLVPRRDSPALDAAINALLADWARLATANETTRREHTSGYPWVRQAAILVARAKVALGEKSVT